MADILATGTTGQSLSIGAHGSPAISVGAERANANLIAQNGSLLPLQVPAGQTQRPDLSMGYRLADHDPAQTIAMVTSGTGGKTLAQLSKGGSTGDYETMVARITAAATAATAAGKTIEVQAMHLIQGEADMRDGTTEQVYRSELDAILADYDADIAAQTGQATPPVFIAGQPASWDSYGLSAPSVGLYHLAEHRERDGWFLVGGQYQLEYFTDNIHMVAAGYYHLGELHARVQNAIRDTGTWDPVCPASVTLDDAGTTITARFHVPAPPLVFNLTQVASQPAYGFSLHNTAAVVASVQITAPDTVTITTDVPVTEPDPHLGYGVRQRVGNLCDSELTPSRYDGAPLANWCAHFLDPIVRGGGGTPVVAPAPTFAFIANAAWVLTADGLAAVNLPASVAT